MTMAGELRKPRLFVLRVVSPLMVRADECISDVIIFPYTGAIAVSGSYFGQDIGGPIKKGDFQCTGSESGLVDCTSSDSTCSQHKTAGVICAESCSTDGEVRLVGGSDATSGHVEVCTSGSWTAICDTNWCEKNAQVVCSQLGFSTLSELFY